MDPMTMSALSGMSGLDMGGGSITPSSSSAATNTGGTNMVGGTGFGGYTVNNAPEPSLSQHIPLLVGCVCVLAALYILKGGAK